MSIINEGNKLPETYRWRGIGYDRRELENLILDFREPADRRCRSTYCSDLQSLPSVRREFRRERHSFVWVFFPTVGAARGTTPPWHPRVWGQYEPQPGTYAQSRSWGSYNSRFFENRARDWLISPLITAWETHLRRDQRLESPGWGRFTLVSTPGSRLFRPADRCLDTANSPHLESRRFRTSEKDGGGSTIVFSALRRFRCSIAELSVGSCLRTGNPNIGQSPQIDENF